MTHFDLDVASAEAEAALRDFTEALACYSRAPDEERSVVWARLERASASSLAATKRLRDLTEAYIRLRPYLRGLRG